MSMTVYFAKLNLVSEELFDLYDSKITLNTIGEALLTSVKSKPEWSKEFSYIDDAGESHVSSIDYTLNILTIDGWFVEGWFYKKSKLYFNVLVEETNQLIRQSTKNTEAIRFCLDTEHGYIAYNTTTRFGYREFIDAFAEVINAGEENLGFGYRYNSAICSKGIDLTDINQELKGKGKLRELRIKMQPPNPSEDLLAQLQERCDGVVQEMQVANVTETEMLYTTKGTTGINLDAPFIQEKICDLQSLYSTLPIEESTRKGYVSVNAVSMTGEKYSSGDSKPLKIIVEHMDEFLISCRDAIRKFF